MGSTDGGRGNKCKMQGNGSAQMSANDAGSKSSSNVWQSKGPISKAQGMAALSKRKHAGRYANAALRRAQTAAMAAGVNGGARVSMSGRAGVGGRGRDGGREARATTTMKGKARVDGTSGKARGDGGRRAAGATPMGKAMTRAG